MEKKPIDDLDIQALVDAQLDWEAEKRVWVAIKNSPEFFKRYQELINQKKALLLWWATEHDPAEKKPAARSTTDTVLV